MFSSCGPHRELHARERARVTMVTRLCAGVEHIVWFRIDKSPCSFGNPSEPFAVTDWISKLSGVLVYVLYYGQYRKPHVLERARVTMFARLRAGVEHHVLFRTDKSQCWFGNPSEPLALAD